MNVIVFIQRTDFFLNITAVKFRKMFGNYLYLTSGILCALQLVPYKIVCNRQKKKTVSSFGFSSLNCR